MRDYEYCDAANAEIERLTTVLEDAEQRVKDVQFVCDHNKTKIVLQQSRIDKLVCLIADRDARIELLDETNRRTNSQLLDSFDRIAALEAMVERLEGEVKHHQGTVAEALVAYRQPHGLGDMGRLSAIVSILGEVEALEDKDE